MGEAASPTAGGKTVGEHELEAVGNALGALRLAWGDVYMFGHDERGYWAARRHKPGTGVLHAGTPEELGHLCAADFEASLS